MVATKQGNGKRRMSGRQNNNGRFKQMNMNKQFNSRVVAGINMFNPSQIPDNPGYVDFNEPSPPLAPLKINHKAMPSKSRYPRRMNQSNMKSNPQRNHVNNSNGWGPGRVPPPVHMVGNQHPIPPPPPHVGNFRNNPMPRLGRPPLGMRPPIMPPPPPPPPPPPGRFGPLNMNIGRFACPGPIRRGKSIQSNRKNVKNRKRGGSNMGGTNSKGKKSTTTKKTLHEIVNQYPLDKAWVTDEIRDEQKKKEDIENRLKGNKDDKLFAAFKVQRDKFVKMYETARLEYIGKHPEQDIEKILTESDKGDTKENSNAKTKTK